MATKKATKSVAKKPAKKSTKTRKAKTEALDSLIDAVADAAVAAKAPTTGVVDPIGDETDGEARVLLTAEAEAAASEIASGEDDETVAGDDADEASATGKVGAKGEAGADDEDIDEDESVPATPRPPAKLERLQKILAQAGVASRRKAEEMIEQGRVQVNGAVVTELGTKADAGRDHIRVDGKLLHGAERLRYFMLNKPKGFVTTVKDPEGRPTVMQFFDKMRERLYPVGRLDYMSEGLLVVTNDGDLANKLTKAGSGVEKVYLVKVAGQPTESELELLRAGVNIERGKPGTPLVRTSPARIRQVRQGDNPWYEVVLIEGRNRELRKMFVAVGHFVEKIRRVGYGPLVLDQEPGNMRELDANELTALRLAAEGKARTPKAKEVRRRNLADSQLPTVRPKPSRPLPGQTFGPSKPVKPYVAPGVDADAEATSTPGEFRPKRAFGAERSSRPDKSFGSDKPFRPARPAAEGFRPAARPGTDRGSFGAKKFGAPRTGAGAGPARPAWKKDDRAPRPAARFNPGPGTDTGSERRPPAAKPFGDRPAAGRSFGARPPAGPSAGRTYGAKPAAGRTFGGKPAGKSFGDRPSAGKPAWKKPGSSDRPASSRPAFKSPSAPRRDAPAREEEFTPIKPGGLRIDPIEPSAHEDRAPRTFSRPPMRLGAERPQSTGRPPSGGRPPFDRPRTGKPSFGKPRFEKAGSDRPRFERSGPAKPRFDKPDSDKPRFEKSRFDGASRGRSSSGPGRSSSEGFSGARPLRPESGMARPFTTSSGKPRAGGARPSSKPFKPGGHSGFKPKTGGFSKSGPKGSGFKGKSGGAKRSGPHTGGKKRG